jgi:hypothetical protein
MAEGLILPGGQLRIGFRALSKRSGRRFDLKSSRSQDGDCYDGNAAGYGAATGAEAQVINGERWPMKPSSDSLAVAGNGLLHRRALLGRGLALVGALGTGAAVSTGAAAEPLTEPEWSLVPGEPMPAYQVPSAFEKNVVRLIDNPNSLPQVSHARTPHQLLNGIITPELMPSDR